MSNPISRMIDKDPERMVRALVQILPLLRKTDEFLSKLEAEKGPNHAMLAKAMFKVFDVVGLLAVYQGRHDAQGSEFTDVQRKEVLNTAVEVLQCMCTELGQNLGVSKDDFSEISDAAKAQSEATLDLATA